MEEKEFNFFKQKIKCCFKSLEIDLKCPKCGYSNDYYEGNEKNKFWEGYYDFEFIVFYGKREEYICRYWGQGQEGILYNL